MVAGFAMRSKSAALIYPESSADSRRVRPVRSASWAIAEDNAVNAIIPSDPGNLQSCASPNFYFTASTPTDILNALQAMFEQSVSTAHVSN